MHFSRFRLQHYYLYCSGHVCAGANPVLPMDSVIIQPGAAVCADAEIIGDVRIGAGTVVHPRCRILAQGGPVIIGENNIIEELTVVVNPNRQGAQPTPMVIGSGNWFEVGAVIRAVQVRACTQRRRACTDACVRTDWGRQSL